MTIEFRGSQQAAPKFFVRNDRQHSAFFAGRLAFDLATEHNSGSIMRLAERILALVIVFDQPVKIASTSPRSAMTKI